MVDALRAMCEQLSPRDRVAIVVYDDSAGEARSIVHTRYARSEMSHSFPASFRFGTATSATQIEGGCTTIDWWEFAREPGRIAHGDEPDVACDHWNRVREDVALVERLGTGAHRLSIEWGRIEPEEGRFDDDALARYREELALLRARGIEPIVTLHHFSFPTWLSQRGGATADDMPMRFEAFVRHAVPALADHVELWITINEPNILVAQGWLLGVWPPAAKRAALVPRVVGNLRRAHARAYQAIHELQSRASVGIAHHIRVATPATGRLRDRAAARLFDHVFNRVFLDLEQDFVGVNYYSRDMVRFAPTRPAELFTARGIADGARVSDLGWEIYPEGLGIVLRDLARLRKPIWITENGIADASDAHRGHFIVDHLREVARAIDSGIDVRGYLHWSLLDNFEWAEGYAPRFGLYAVDFATQARVLRPSGELYARIARDRRVD